MVSCKNSDQSFAKNNPFRPAILQENLGQSIFSRNIVFHKTLDSTNRLAKELGANGAPEGTLVLCEEQTAGRGRMGRRWLSPRYANLLFSVLLRPKIPPDKAFMLTMILALGAIEAMGERYALKAKIKWPNDLYVGRKKLGGILTEFSTWKESVEYVILGLGLNVNWRPEDEEGMLYPATSILVETGRRISRGDLLVRILEKLESSYGMMLSGELQGFYKRWNEESMLFNKRVEVRAGGEMICGKALRIDTKGALIIEDDQGQERKIVCGDVSVREISA